MKIDNMSSTPIHSTKFGANPCKAKCTNKEILKNLEEVYKLLQEQEKSRNKIDFFDCTLLTLLLATFGMEINDTFFSDKGECKENANKQIDAIA